MQKYKFLAFILLISVSFACSNTSNVFDKNSKYYFDGSISREALENYLDRSVTAGFFLTPGSPQRYLFPFREDDIRMIQNIGAKFIGRAIYRWGEESLMDDPVFFDYAERLIVRMHKFDPEMVFQACLFESVSKDVNNLAIPSWVFEAFNLPIEKRNFNEAEMTKRINPDAPPLMNGRCPMVNNLETKLWFYFLAKSYIDIGIEALHLGQVELIGRDDPEKENYKEIIDMIREYAKKNARRHYILLDGHTPKFGFVKDGISLLDFNARPLRIKEITDKPMEGKLEVGHSNSIYQRSQGAISPSGWKAEHMPFLVEFDNFGMRRDPPAGEPVPEDIYCWGYDDITWFALQDEAYRNKWLWYAFDWIKETDPNGHLQMCLIRMITHPDSGETYRSYFANTKSEACPVGYSQEETIKEIWNTRLK